MNISFVHAPGEPATYANCGVAARRSKFPTSALHARASRAFILSVSPSVQSASPSTPQPSGTIAICPCADALVTRATFDSRLAPNSPYHLADSARRIPALFSPRVFADHAAPAARALTRATVMRVRRRLCHAANLWSACNLPGCGWPVEAQACLSREPYKLRALKGIHCHVVHCRTGRAPKAGPGGVA